MGWEFVLSVVMSFVVIVVGTVPEPEPEPDTFNRIILAGQNKTPEGGVMVMVMVILCVWVGR